MDNKFSHLHVHTEYSIWDGISRIKQLVETAAKMNMSHLAITDHGTMGGSIKFYETCKNNSVKPIIGMEGYFCDDMSKRDKDSKYYHLLLLAKNNKGYSNLMKLVTKSNKDGRYKKPRFDFNCLAEHSEGIIVSSACILGEISQNILHNPNGVDESIKIVKKFKELFGEDYYLEVMYQGTPGGIEPLSEDTKKLMSDQQLVINNIWDIAKKLDTKMIVTNDVHYVCQEDYVARYMKMKIGSWSNDDTSDESFSSGKADDTLDYHLKSQDEMWAKWGQYFSEALTNTYEIGEKCNVEIPLLSLGDNIGSRMPYFKIPEDEGFKIYLDSDRSNSPLDVKYVKYLTIKSLREKSLDNNPEYIKRLKYELAIIGSNPSFCTYFLITRDFVEFARNSNIYVGPGRGSAGSSLVMHLLGVTLPDPIEHGLDFNRFLSADKSYQTTLLDYV